MDREWINDRKPPNETWVEVMRGNGEILEAMAVYGRDGMRPHWRTREGHACDPSQFNRWRLLDSAKTEL